MPGEAIVAPVVEPGHQPEVAEDGQREQEREQREHGAERARARPKRQPAGPEARDENRDLQLAVGDGRATQDLIRRARWDDPPTGFVEPDQQEQGQQADAGQIERDRDGAAILTIQPPGRGIQAKKRHAQDDKRPDDAAHRVVHPMRRKVEEAAGEQEEHAEYSAICEYESDRLAAIQSSS